MLVPPWDTEGTCVSYAGFWDHRPEGQQVHCLGMNVVYPARAGLELVQACLILYTQQAQRDRAGSREKSMGLLNIPREVGCGDWSE